MTEDKKEILLDCVNKLIDVSETMIKLLDKDDPLHLIYSVILEGTIESMTMIAIELKEAI